MASLLDPLTDEQQRFVDVVAGVFLEEPGQWPVFDYVEGTLDKERLDAWEVLESFPRLDRYSAIWCLRAPGNKPAAETDVGLTIVGIHHCEALCDFTLPLLPTFFALLTYLAERRRHEPLSPRTPRQLVVESQDVITALSERGMRLDDLPLGALYQMMEKEPPCWWSTGGAVNPDGSWTKNVPRDILDFAEIGNVEDYIARLERLLIRPARALAPAAPSPLGLVAALDYLNTVWRLVPGHRSRLFDIHSVQRAAKLVFPAETADEFDARLSGVGEILRSTNVPRSPKGAKQKKVRDTPLAGLEAYLKDLLPGSSHARIERAIRTLQNIIHVRDAGQHSAAGRKGAAALSEIGIGYPISDFAAAWEAIQAQSIEALEALREELAGLAT